MRSALVFAALTLAACTAKSNPTGDQLIPADATLLVGADVAGILSSEIFGLFKPKLAKQVDELAWLDLLRDCGVDPIQHRLTLVAGSDGVDEAAAVFTGDGLGDATKIQCIGDKFNEQRRGNPMFVLHDRTAGPPPAGQLAVAMVIDPRTVVFTSPGWAAPVHDLTLGKGRAAMDGPSRALFDRAARTAHLWSAGKIPAKVAADARGGLPAEPREIYAAIDLSAGLGVRVDIGFGGPEQAAPVRSSVETTAPMIKSLGPMIGLAPKTIESIKLEMKGDEVHFEMLLAVADALALDKKFDPPPEPPPPPDIQHPPPS